MPASNHAGLSPNFAGLFPRKNPVPPKKNLVKCRCFFPRQTALKRDPSLFLRTCLCRNTHVPTHPPAQTGPGQPSRPGPPARTSQPPAQRSCTCDRIFPLPFFFLGTQDFFSGNWKKNRYKRKRLTYCIEATLPTAQCSTLFPEILLSCSLLHVHHVA